MPLNIAIAMVAITVPCTDAPCPLESLQVAALAMELMDPSERRWIFVGLNELTDDLKTIHARYEDLKYAPYSCDADRFPCKEVILEMVQANRAYHQWLLDRQILFHDDWWIDDAIAECNCIYNVLDMVRDVKQDYYFVWVRRRMLAKLRDELGYADYYAGSVPACVPLQFLWRLDDDD